MKNCQEVIDFLKDDRIPLNCRINSITNVCGDNDIWIRTVTDKDGCSYYFGIYFDDNNELQIITNIAPGVHRFNAYYFTNVCSYCLKDTNEKVADPKEVSKKLNEFFGANIYKVTNIGTRVEFIDKLYEQDVITMIIGEKNNVY